MWYGKLKNFPVLFKKVTTCNPSLPSVGKLEVEATKIEKLHFHSVPSRTPCKEGADKFMQAIRE
jgi:hypothetical protein